MTASVSCRNPLCALGILQLGNWAQGTSDRRWQDKNRKVRAVGSVRDSTKYSTCRTHCEYLLQLALFRNALSPLSFQHPTEES